YIVDKHGIDDTQPRPVGDRDAAAVSGGGIVLNENILNREAHARSGQIDAASVAGGRSALNRHVANGDLVSAGDEENAARNRRFNDVKSGTVRLQTDDGHVSVNIECRGDNI